MLHVERGPRWREIQDSVDLFWVGFDSSLGDDKTQEFARGYPKGALRRIQLHAVLSECRKGLSEVVDVVSHAHAFDHHVVNVGLHISVDLVDKNLIDHSLISESDILQYEGHYLVAVSPSVYDEGHFFLSFGAI